MAGHLTVAIIPRAEDGDWSEANARAIAALPELMEAAKAHVKAEEDALDEMNRLGMQPSGPEIPYMIRLNAFRAALAKMEGGE
jgi:hypothetical protein